MAENIVELLTDVADAIREKKGTTEKINAQDFSEEIRTIESGGGSGWTGHADADGLRAIGWTDEDIAYYQKYGVNWNAENDEYHKVSDDNKALYGVLTADNIQEYKDRIVYLPKIDFSGVTSMANKFKDCRAMVAIPMIDTSAAINMSFMFENCSALTCIPSIDTSRVTNLNYMCNCCYSLSYFYKLDFSNAIQAGRCFSDCRSLKAATLKHTGKINNVNFFFSNAHSLTLIDELDCTNMKQVSFLINCVCLVTIKLKNIKGGVVLSDSLIISKESLLYIIENEAATEAITITLHAYAYQRLAEDADIVTALANHPLISLASA